MIESNRNNKSKKKKSLSRRDFIKLSTIAVAGASVAACETQSTEHQEVMSMSMTSPDQMPEVPYAPAEPPSDTFVVLTPDEAKEVDALTSRLYPGDLSDPGAHEAGVTNFIDKMLAFHDGYVDPTYTQPPHAKTYEGDQPPPDKTDELGEIIWVKKAEIERYGYQSLLTPTKRYRNGLASVDKFSMQKFGAKFVDLSTDQQDQILDAMEKDDKGEIDVFKDPTAKAFFKLLQQHTIQGMFSDPAYGGNKDMIGWQQIGYPGAQRAYTTTDMDREEPVRPPQSLAMLHKFHAGMNANMQVTVPPSGSELTPKP